MRVGKTVSYGAAGPQGLLEGKKVVVATARGGSYVMDPAALRFDLQKFYLRRILGFLGLRDITCIHAQNQMRPKRAGALGAALARIG